MDSVIIAGLGEVGSAIKELEDRKGSEVHVLEKDQELETGDYDVMHVCFPYTFSFVDNVKSYIRRYKPGLTIIQSTVPIGTCSQIKSKYHVVHSPVRGMHPDLTPSLLTFVKYVGGDEDSVAKALPYLAELGMAVKPLGPSECTEAAKILSTSYYAWNIIYADFVEEVCKEENLSFKKVFVDWNRTYNQGYEMLGMSHVIRPILSPPENKTIGGHCLIPNARFLRDNTMLQSFVKRLIMVYRGKDD